MGESGYSLYCIAGPMSGKVVDLPVQGLGIGRGQQAGGAPWLQVPDQELSPHHADLEWMADKRAFRFRQRAPANLSRINRKLISGELELPENSHIGLGSSQFILHKKSEARKTPRERDERTSDYCLQLLPGGYEERLHKHEENVVGLNMLLTWDPRWSSFLARADGTHQLTVSRESEARRADFPFYKPVALEVGDVLVADFCRYELTYDDPGLRGVDVRQFRNPRGLLPGYLRIEKLGTGISSEVFLMLDPEGKQVAVKFLLPQFEHDKQARAGFENQGRAALSFQHDRLIKVLKVGTNDAQEQFIISEYIREGSLSDTLGRIGRLPLGTVKGLCLDVASGLSYLHRRGVVHRDVKPTNIFHRGNRFVISDFGITKGFDRGATERTGFTVGSPGYMAPEHFRDRTEPNSDQYALGVVLFECLSGRKMFDSDDPKTLAHLSKEDRARSLELLPDTLTVAARTALLKMLAFKPEDRFESVEEAARRFSSE